MVLGIPRSLADGPHYSPAWRSQAAESYLGAILASADAPGTLAEIQRTERDPYVRQWVRFRYTGRCVAQGRFKYAAECVARNDATHASSLIKTLLIADLTYEEIAEELGTSRENIVAFAMIFFDVRRFLGNETWLKRMIFAKPMDSAFTPAQPRERRWLSIAFYRGWPGVEQVVLQRRLATNDEVQEQMSQIKAILTSLALEHAHDLESSGTQPSAVDLRCLLALRHSESGQHHEDDTYRGKPMALWMAEVSSGERPTAEAEPENPQHDTVRKPDASVKETSAMEPRRLRARFARAGRLLERVAKNATPTFTSSLSMAQARSLNLLQRECKPPSRRAGSKRFWKFRAASLMPPLFTGLGGRRRRNRISVQFWPALMLPAPWLKSSEQREIPTFVSGSASVTRGAVLLRGVSSMPPNALLGMMRQTRRA